ncbi:MAG: exodeoxyribonuclease VII large subunit [Prevotellaceae bacterium]|nr:exodeoxyribonuclease VII large subunit [Prevotellaceae bacterium]
MKNTVTLYELNSLVKDVVSMALPDEYWVEAELSDVNVNNGNCYMELIQKDERSNTPVAKASAKCWRSTWAVIRPHFERVTNQTLHRGIKVLLRVYAQFHENYGFSWIVTDIDPTYTMGDMARKRQEIVRILKEQGVFDLNKQLPLPMFNQRIAVISSASAAGYGDFSDQLSSNQYGFHFTTTLFPAIMQGERVEESIISALNDINDDIDSYDCVVIIRGGGATSDLSGFDTLALAENVANFPLPIITGIGHERDESVLDMVSNTRLKTPTAVASFLVDNLKQVSDLIDSLGERIANRVTSKIEMERLRLEKLSSAIPVLFSLAKTRHEASLTALFTRLENAVTRRVSDSKHHLVLLSQRIPPLVTGKIAAERHRLEMLSQRANALDPALLLRRGYSITLFNGHSLRDASQLKDGDEIITVVEKGKIKSKVQK